VRLDLIVEVFRRRNAYARREHHMFRQYDLTSEDQESFEAISSFWNGVNSIENLDGATRGALEQLQVQVTDAMFQRPPNRGLAERLTAYAMLILEKHKF
jgi:hypothetical protein